MKSANEFSTERQYIINSLSRIEEDLNMSIVNLANKYPDAFIDSKFMLNCKSPNALKQIPFDTKLQYLRRFEDYIETLPKYVQTKLNL